MLIGNEGKLEEIKAYVFKLWDTIQNVVNENLTVKTEVDKKMVKNVEKKIQQVFEIFELGHVEFEVIMDDSRDVEYAQLLQRLMNEGCSDMEIATQLSMF